MDWIEEIVQKTGSYLKNATLFKAFIVYCILGAAGAAGAAIFTKSLCGTWLYVLEIENTASEVRQEMWKLIKVCCPYVYSAVACLITGKIFLKQRVLVPMQEMQKAVEAMCKGELEREMSYRSEDECGSVCSGLEILQRNLLARVRNEWKAAEEQKQINAAFAHDIRTPLTVLKGYTEFLKRYVPKGRVSEEMLMEKLDIMLYQEKRILEFSETMTKLQAMEERLPEYKAVSKEEVIKRMEQMVYGNRKSGLSFSVECEDRNRKEGKVFLDLSIVLEAVENIWSNALRFAASSVEMKIVYEKEKMTVFVADNGPGFSTVALKRAADVYFSEEKKETGNAEHFGIGLSISAMLCQKHGGELSFLNRIEQGAIVAVTFAVNLGKN